MAMSGCINPVRRRTRHIIVHLRSMAAARAKRPRGVEKDREVTYGSIRNSDVPARGIVKQAPANATANHCAAGEAKMRWARLQTARRKAKMDARCVMSSSKLRGICV